MTFNTLFITGTDTGVGKTVATATLALHFLSQGRKVGVMKPFATGCEPQNGALISEDVEFLRSLPLEPGSGNTLLLGLDHDNDPNTIEVAYNDPKGLTRDFIMNGLKAAGRTLGDESLFSEEKWEYVGRYNTKLREFSGEPAKRKLIC